MRTFRQTPFPEYGYDLRGHSENIVDLLDHLEIERIKLVVHDWGGAIGLTAFRNSQERIEKIVLLNTAAFPSRMVPKRILLCRLPILGSLLVRGLNGFAWPATRMATSKSSSIRQERFSSPVRQLAGQGCRLAIRQIFRTNPNIPVSLCSRKPKRACRATSTLRS